MVLRIFNRLILSFTICVSLIAIQPAISQVGANSDSLLRLIDSYKSQDTVLAKLYDSFAFSIVYKNVDSGLLYVRKSLELSEKINWESGVAHNLQTLGEGYSFLEKFDSAVIFFQQALNAYGSLKDSLGLSGVHSDLGEVYRALSNDTQAITHYKLALHLTEALDNKQLKVEVLSNLAAMYGDLGNWSKVKEFSAPALKLATQLNQTGMMARLLDNDARYLMSINNVKEALVVYHQVFNLYRQEPSYEGMSFTLMNMSLCFGNLRNKDSALFYGRSALDTANKYGLKKERLDAYNALFNYANSFGLYMDALNFHLMADSIRNEGNRVEIARNIERSRIKFEQDKKDILLAAEQFKKDTAARKTKTTLVTGLVIVLLGAGLLLWNLRTKQRAKTKIEKAYSTLKLTQAQLIQSEKMASLGELTAGIAHEIQNPLNFVNNFSEVNKELISELVEEVDKGNTEEIKAIAKDIKDNSEKINHHGKRADAIVKGMLQHSRKSSGQKEPTDINALCDEYLRLSYHGLRAKDKQFNADFKTDFDETIDKINVVPQDIGRVLLNLINNAFYAVNEKQKLIANGYQPIAKVSTRRLNNVIEIKVEDNGNGIPQKIGDKIFQPFFTTKPTGEGTGLGLSLSYDIIKAHGGEIKVETKEEEGTIFIIQLPV